MNAFLCNYLSIYICLSLFIIYMLVGICEKKENNDLET